MKIINSGIGSKRGGSSVPKDFVRKYLIMLWRVVSFAITSAAFILPVFMVFVENSTPWYLLLSVLVLLALAVSKEDL